MERGRAGKFRPVRLDWACWVKKSLRLWTQWVFDLFGWDHLGYMIKIYNMDMGIMGGVIQREWVPGRWFSQSHRWWILIYVFVCFSSFPMVIEKEIKIYKRKTYFICFTDFTFNYFNIFSLVQELLSFRKLILYRLRHVYISYVYLNFKL